MNEALNSTFVVTVSPGSFGWKADRVWRKFALLPIVDPSGTPPRQYMRREISNPSDFRRARRPQIARP